MKQKALTAKEVEKLVDALYFYADPETYFATSILYDKPCGEIVKDCSNVLDYKSVPGKRARKVLVKLGLLTIGKTP